MWDAIAEDSSLKAGPAVGKYKYKIAIKYATLDYTNAYYCIVLHTTLIHMLSSYYIYYTNKYWCLIMAIQQRINNSKYFQQTWWAAPTAMTSSGVMVL